MNLRFLGEGGDWHPADVLAGARKETPGDYFGSKVMIHWLDVLKKHAGLPAATDARLLAELFGEDFTMIHLYREDTVAAAVSFTLAGLNQEWHRRTGESAKQVVLPDWEVLNVMISDNVTWLDWCRHRLRMAASTSMRAVVEMRYEDLEREPAAELRRAVTAIMGEEAASAHELTVGTKLVKQRNERSAELRGRWLAEHPGYGSYDLG
ncbi:Stf0 family sulfotransferase [Actinomadura sp. DC4]|uniref:Stf0 family sulfotransferase n=1 Tax=Actinomadura sp. DC4 TaxID=3055069 RepID=UPI0025B237A1|nr:Stf0 family sulfotransferase [Actinomadura sp. DC4]MDN3358652.1 Stf0 family sulfotransferase [Actinomadura sp. DC4]